MKHLTILSILLLAFAITTAQPKIEGKSWEKVAALSDEFNGFEIDQNKWHTAAQGHPELNWTGRAPALFQQESFSIGNGMLKITVGQLPKPIKMGGSTYLYHGGILRSYIKTNVGHYYECRMKMNKTEMGGGFWLCHAGTCGDKTEIDITESVGRLTEQTQSWAYDWDQIMHSNAIHRKTACNEAKRDQAKMHPPTKNSERFYTYGFYWKSPTELLFYLDDEYVYTLHPPIPFDNDLILQFSMEAYDWNPIPEKGSLVATGTLEERTTLIDYIRVYKLVE